MKKALLHILLSLFLAALLLQWQGDHWEKPFRYTLYRIFADSFPNFAPNFTDARGLPQTFYPLQNGITPGYVYNATIVANYALQYHVAWQQQQDSAALQFFFNCVQWLDSAAAPAGPAASLYRFAWQQPWYPAVPAPFTSGMTSGRAIEVLLAAHRLRPDTHYLALAQQLVNGYHIPMEEGGFTLRSAHGWWYEEIAYPQAPTPRILDGHLFALAGLQAWHAYTGNPTAKAYLDSGLAALKHALPAYDRGGGYPWYDMQGEAADENYHALLVQQLRDLYQYTGDTLYHQYAERWAAPLEKPYLYRILRDGNKTGLLMWGVVGIAAWGVMRMLNRFLVTLKF